MREVKGVRHILQRSEIKKEVVVKEFEWSERKGNGLKRNL